MFHFLAMRNINTHIIEDTEIVVSFFKDETIPPKLEITRLISCAKINSDNR